MKRKISKIVSIFFLTMFAFTTITFAQAELYVPEQTEEYKKWESLSQEQREDTIEPKYYALGIKESLKRSTYNTLLAGNAETGDIFNLANTYETIIKNQRLTGTCWAFSAASMLESTMAVRYSLLGRQYSAMHMEYVASTMYYKTLGYGGNTTMAIAYMVNGNGPVLESDFPMEDVYDEKNNSIDTYYLADIDEVDLDKTTQLKLTKTTEFPAIYKKYDSVTGEITYSNGSNKTYEIEEINVAREKIKSHIKNYGAVTATMYANFGTITINGIDYNFYDSENNIYCCTNNSSVTSMNHQVTIVGWDDSKNAYIVQNSYGENFGVNGYFYVSYDDVRIEENIYGINEVEELTEENSYDEIYQYDELGLNYGIYSTDPEAYYANVFSRDTSLEEKDEYIQEIGLYIMDTTGIEIYVNTVDGELTEIDEELTEDSKLKLVHSGEILEPGYHVISLNPTDDTKLVGEKFAIVVKSINQEGAIIPIETNLYESNFKSYSTVYDTAKANEGESFYSLDGETWEEINGTQVGPTQILRNTNVCVRAFTKYVDVVTEPAEVSATGITLDKESINLIEGETEILTATVLPENATNQNVTFESSNEEVATVSNGVVRALKAGESVITVKTLDGDYTATCNVTVTEKEIEKILVTGVTLNKTSETLNIGKTLTLVATISPSNATNKNVMFESSNEEVATVSNGVITALKEGTANITAKTEDGSFTALCTITVENPNKEIKVESISLNRSELEMQVSDKTTLIITFNPKLPTNTNVKWESSNTKVATVDANGIVTAVENGTAVITVTSEDGEYTAKCTVTVTKKVEDPDDIYKQQTNQEVKQDNNEDTTTAMQVLPNAGTKTMAFIIATLVLLVMTYSFIKYKNLRDIK